MSLLSQVPAGKFYADLDEHRDVTESSTCGGLAADLPPHHDILGNRCEDDRVTLRFDLTSDTLATILLGHRGDTGPLHTLRSDTSQGLEMETSPY